MSAKIGVNFAFLLAVLVLVLHYEPVESDGECKNPGEVMRKGCHILCVRNLDMGQTACFENKVCLCKEPMCYDFDQENENETEGCQTKTPLRCETDEYENRICRAYDYYELIPPEFKQYHQKPSTRLSLYPDEYDYV